MRNLIRAGVPRSVAMQISGHLTENVFERYNIDDDNDLREAIGKLSAYVDGLPSTPTVSLLRAPQNGNSYTGTRTEHGQSLIGNDLIHH